MADEYDVESYRPGSNLKEDFDGTIVAASFEKGQDAQNWAAHLTVMGDDQEEVDVIYGLGSDWTSYDGGNTVEHPKGPSKKFNNQTAYAEWNAFAATGIADGYDTSDSTLRPMAWPKAGEAYNGPGAILELSRRNREVGGKGPQVAATWIGLRFHFDVFTRPMRRRVVTKAADGSESVEWKDDTIERMLPTRFLGVASEAGAAQPVPAAPSSAPAAQGAPAQPQPAPGNVGGTEGSPAPAAPAAGAATGASSYPALADLPPVDKAAVIQLARTVPFDQFVDRVMGLQVSTGGDMLGQAKVIQALADETMYNALRAG